jgi:hypothetical protein
MGKAKSVSSPADPARSVTAALARAASVLREGNLKDAAKWAALAASLGESQKF